MAAASILWELMGIGAARRGLARSVQHTVAQGFLYQQLGDNGPNVVHGQAL